MLSSTPLLPFPVHCASYHSVAQPFMPPSAEVPDADTSFAGSDRPLVAPAEKAGAQNRHQAIKPPPGYILIVDDEILLRQAMVRACTLYLGMERNSFLTAANMIRALAVYSQYEGSLLAVLSDVHMVSADEGYALHYSLRHKHSYQGPFVLMSARTQHPYRIDYIARDKFPTRFFAKNPPPWEEIASWLREQWDASF